MKQVLIVTQPFGAHPIGAVIEDAREIARLLGSEHVDKVREAQLPAAEGAERVSRDQAVAKACAASLPDAVYEIDNYNFWVRDTARIDLFGLFSDTPRAEIEDWLRRARQLRSDAYWVGDAHLSDDARYDAIKERWLLENPGFSESSQQDALYRGIVAALH